MECHLVVLVHGLWGTVAHFDYISSQLEASGAHVHRDLSTVPGVDDPTPPKGQLPTIVYRAYGNEGYFTYDGIDVCGTRVATEIEDEVQRLNASGKWKVTNLSITGYSLGGLVSRFAIGILHRRQVPEKFHFKLDSFTTFATPHVGVEVLGSRLLARAFNFIGSISMASTSRQLFLCDKYHRDAPLLQYMADPRSPFYEGLKQFENLSLYANVAHDRRCEWYTASISAEDPFAGRSTLVSGPYIAGYEPTLLEYDYKSAATPPQFVSSTSQTASSGGGILGRAVRFVSRAVRRAGAFAVVVFNLVVVVPLWFVAFTINATYQTVVSNLRQRSFRSQGRMNTDLEPTIDQLLEDEADEVVESLYRAVTGGRDRQRAPAGTSDADAEKTPLLPKLLELNRAQTFIVAKLNELDWNKVPVRITKHPHAHAAIIVRFPAKGFEEGETTVKHWVELFFTKQRVQ